MIGYIAAYLRLHPRWSPWNIITVDVDQLAGKSCGTFDPLAMHNRVQSSSARRNMTMRDPVSITFVTNSNNREILANNFLASPCFSRPNPPQILIQEGFSCAGKAYNDAINKSVNDLIVFAHQDIVFATTWIADLQDALRCLDDSDPNWGVLGCYGVTEDNIGKGYVLQGEHDMHGERFDKPEPVQTLDEIVLIIRKSSGLRFDESLPDFHLYGADICMEAARGGRRSYAISAFCIHNPSIMVALPKGFYNCYGYMKKKWIDWLPIQTTCIRISRFDKQMYRRKLAEVYLRYVQGKTTVLRRVPDGRTILRKYDEAFAAEDKLKDGRPVCR